MARYDDVLPAMDLLKQQGLTLGLISNMNSGADEIVENMGLAPYLDFAVTSGEVGVEKPHAPIFQEALRRSGATPEDTLHVGDQLTSDIAGAINAGIAPVLIDRDRNHIGYTACPPHRIHDGTTRAGGEFVERRPARFRVSISVLVLDRTTHPMNVTSLYDPDHSGDVPCAQDISVEWDPYGADDGAGIAANEVMQLAIAEPKPSILKRPGPYANLLVIGLNVD